jgi:LmbE family N-acetylglucosaminyl deacetylase
VKTTRLAPTALVAALVAAALPALRAQVRPVYDTGADGIVQLLHRLPTIASAMHTGAHPDDEDSALIARLARGDHARVAYLALNRGEGGQNVLGPEQGDALGVIRTEELLQARRLDGGEQIFTRVRDFGYTESRPETVANWGGETIALGDMVRAIRLYRPLVIVSRFTGTTVDGHGNHQLAGYLTPIAFRKAADPAEFPEQIAEGLRAWSAAKLYVTEPSQPTPGTEATLRIPTGLLDPVLGRSYFQIALEGRSLHRTQEQGSLELAGPQSSGVRLLESRVKGPSSETSVFDGIDTTLTGIAGLSGLRDGTVARALQDAQSAAVAARDAVEVRAPARVVPDLARGLRAVRAALAALETPGLPAEGRAEARFLLETKEREFVEALARTSGLQVEALSDQETLAPGETATVTVQAFVADRERVTLGAPQLVARDGLETTPAPSPSPAAITRRRLTETPDLQSAFRVTARADASPTVPYWLVRERHGNVFEWPKDDRQNRPFGPPILEASLPAEVGGVSVSLRAPVEFRFVDAVRGELRRPLHVVPSMSVSLADELLIVPASARPATRALAVRLVGHAAADVAGTVRLDVPAGWKTTPAEAPFRVEGREQRTDVRFQIEIPGGVAAGAYPLAARATVGTTTYEKGVRVLSYPHIQVHRVLEPATATVRVFPLEVARVRVGYVVGSGDRVPDAIVRMGLPLTRLDEETLFSGDLSDFDVIVAGILAAKVRPDFVSSHGRLLDWVKRGGTLVVQYQRPDYAERNLPPFPARMNERVTDENAPVTVLAPKDPIFSFPNRIGPSDFEGWVQERSVSNMNPMDDRWTALLESHDEGDPPQKGLLIEAQVEQGLYVYAAVSFFRQLPAGVPGAYRLFANLLSRPKAPAAAARAAAGASRPSR